MKAFRELAGRHEHRGAGQVVRLGHGAAREPRSRPAARSSARRGPASRRRRPSCRRDRAPCGLRRSSRQCGRDTRAWAGRARAPASAALVVERQLADAAAGRQPGRTIVPCRARCRRTGDRNAGRPRVSMSAALARHCSSSARPRSSTSSISKTPGARRRPAVRSPGWWPCDRTRRDRPAPQGPAAAPAAARP